MSVLLFRCPGIPLAARVLLERALPGVAVARRERMVEAGALRRTHPTPDGPRPGAPLRGSAAPGALLWLESAEGAPPRPDPSTGGGALRLLAPAWPWPEVRGAGFVLRAVAERDGLSELVLEPPGALEASLDVLADAGCPLLGDVRRGGVLVEGGLRWRDADAPEPEGFWPAEPVFAPDARDPGAREGLLVVSRASLDALRRGHPWVLFDRETGDPGAFAAGAVVRVGARRGAPWGLARVEGDPPIAARAWAAGALRPREAPSVEARVARALARRAALHARADAEGGTDAYRLVHGEADELPGLAVDRLGGVLRALVTGRAAWAVRDRALRALASGLADALGDDPPVVEVLHLPRRPPGDTVCVWRRAGPPPPEPLVVREAGLRLRVDPGLGTPDRPRPGTGLFLDQRDNRARLRERARADGRYLNLFAHTGAFSAALLAGGAGEVVSVDLSAAYLAWLEENLERSGLPRERHRSVRRDARRALAELGRGPGFDGIVLDPPTAAAAGRRFWSVRGGLGTLLGGALERLQPGGWLLLARNDRRGRGGLAGLARQAAAAVGVPLAAVEGAPPGCDFPSRRGFPEGDPTEAVLLTRAQPGGNSG